MRRKPRHYVSGRMRRDFARAILVGAVVAAAGFLLVHTALGPARPEQGQAVSGRLPPATCERTLAAWKDAERAVAGAAAAAADVGARCRLLSCPALDCAALQGLRGAVASLAATAALSARRPESLVTAAESPACGTVLTAQATRLAAGLSETRGALDLCAEHGSCAALRAGGASAGAEAGLAPLTAKAAALASAARSLALSEAPAPRIVLDQTRYTAGDAIRASVDPGRNRCLADGGTLEVFAVEGGGTPSKSFGSPLSLSPGAVQSLLLEGPPRPGRYLLAVRGGSGSGLMLASLPFDIEAARSGCSGFSGRWDTDRGVLTASVRHGILRGTYRRAGAERPGFLLGAVQGRHFHGNWTSELGSGGAHLVLTAQGDRFIGTTGTKPGSEDGAGLWRGRCMPAHGEKITE